MKVANEMASMLEAFHDKGFVHGGVNSETILVTEVSLLSLFLFLLYKSFYTSVSLVMILLIFAIM